MDITKRLRAAKNDKGQAAVEFVVVIPILTLLLVMLVQFIMITMGKTSMTQAARLAAYSGLSETEDASLARARDFVTGSSAVPRLVASRVSPKLDPSTNIFVGALSTYNVPLLKLTASIPLFPNPFNVSSRAYFINPVNDGYSPTFPFMIPNMPDATRAYWVPQGQGTSIRVSGIKGAVNGTGNNNNLRWDADPTTILGPM